MQRHRHPGHRADLLSPLACAVHYDFCLDVTVIRADAGGATIAHSDAGDTDPLADDDAALPGTTGECRGEIDRVRPAITGQPDRPGQVSSIEHRVTGGCLSRADELAVDVVGPRCRRGP